MRWALVIAFAGCFQPEPPEGAACSPSMLCPEPLLCDRGTCNRHLSDAAPDAPPTCTPAPTAAFAAPVLSPLSTASFEGTPALPADQLEIYFKTDRSTIGSGNDIYVATRAPGGSFGTPVLVAELSVPDASDESPTLSDDGLTIWFTSNRAGTYDIYTATRASRASAWAAPVLVPELSSPRIDNGIMVLPSQLVAYLHSDRSGAMAVYRATRTDTGAAWSTPVRVTELGADPENPWVSADDCTIYFEQTGPTGGDDLFYAMRPAPGLPFGARQPLASLDSSADDDDPWLSPDQRYIIYSSNRTGAGSWDLYEATR